MVEAFDKHSGKRIWQQQINHGILSGPTVAEDYIAVGTDASTLIVLNKKTGQPAWDFSLSGDVLAKPVISHHKIIVKTIDGNLYAFDLKNGNKLWVVDHGSPSLILKASSSP